MKEPCGNGLFIGNFIRVITCLCLLSPTPLPAADAAVPDALHTLEEPANIPRSLSPGFLGIEGYCPGGKPEGTINLAEVVTRALCNDPRTRESWAFAVTQAAELGIERAAYTPTGDASLRNGPGRTWLNEAAGDEDTIGTNSGTVQNASLDFTWTLFDFGQREVEVESARQTLLAATSIHNATVQAVFLEAASAYYNLIAAKSAVAIAREVELFNRRTLLDAEALALEDGGMEENERLQAQTSVEQAALDLNDAEGEIQSAQGELAVLLGFAPNISVNVDTNDVSKPDHQMEQSIDELIAQALVSHPEIHAAQARLKAAIADVDGARHINWPTLSLVQENQYYRDALGERERNHILALEMSIPIFDRSNHYRKRAALAELDSARAEIESTRQDIALNVWYAYQSLKTQSIAFERTTQLLDTAQKLLQSEQRLFRSGDGDMLDLLYAQEVVADASQGQLEALTAWREARLELSASLGQLGFWSIREASARK